MPTTTARWVPPRGSCTPAARRRCRSISASGYAADEYRLLGKISGPPPFRGVLVHRGWVTDEVRLPRVLRPAPGRLPAIAPAEVELK